MERVSEVTASCEVKVSSRQAMIASLTDGSTETFWESGDEDRSKCKWISIALPAAHTFRDGENKRRKKS